MTSVGKRFALNLNRGKSTKKKSSDGRQDELDVEHSAYAAYRKSSIGHLQPGSGMPHKTQKSNSLGSVNADMDTPLDQDDIMALTQDVRSFSDALATLKNVFNHTDGGEDYDVKVVAHKELGEVLCILRNILQKYPALHTTDVLTTAAVLITKIKSFNYEDASLDVGELHYSIDQLALAFSSSVSEFLMGDVESFPTIQKAKSYDNLIGDNEGETPGEEDKDNVLMSGASEDCHAILMRLDTGVSVALERAKVWSKYAKDIISYIDKRATLETEFSKSLSKLASTVRPVITEDVYLPFQSIYCTALDNPLNQRRIEHEKTRKSIKEHWSREFRKMQEAVVNLRKAKAMYIQRQQEYEKAREAAQKVETETQTQSSAANTAKADKKRKLEEDAMHRAAEAETTYKACVIEANKRQEELEKVKTDVLSQIRDLIMHCENTMKVVTMAYFQLQHTVTAPLPVQYLSLCQTSQQYEPGTQYAEYIRSLQPQISSSTQEQFIFEKYTGDRGFGERKPSTQSSGSGSSDVLGDDSPSPQRMAQEKEAGLKATKIWGQHAGGSDTDSISGSSYKSRESSPSASPYNHRSGRMHTSGSMNELAEADRDGATDNRLGVVMGEVSEAGHAFRGICLSLAARTHVFRKLRTPSRCRECDSYVYFQGAECARCGLTSHKKCLESLHFECGNKGQIERRMTTFGVDFSAHVQETHTEIPHLVCKCTAEIDARGLQIKGIYRVSGVKSKVEKLCQSFEIDEGNLDLSEHHPNIISNVLKLYLRQLPEPLLTFRLYPYLITLAKEEDKTEDISIMVEKLTQYMSQLPKANFRTCAHIMHHLKRVTAEEESNQMSASNLGIVFGPTLLRPSEGTASLNSLIETPYQTRIIELLISHVETIFGPDEQSHDSSSLSSESKGKVDEVEGAAASGDASQANLTANTASRAASMPVIAVNTAQGAGLPVSDPWDQEKRKDDSSSESDTKWHFSTITGEPLLDELVKAEPRFQQCADDYMSLPLPGSTELDSRGESSTDDTLTTQPDESDVEDLPESLLPDGSQVSLSPKMSSTIKPASQNLQSPDLSSTLKPTSQKPQSPDLNVTLKLGSQKPQASILGSNLKPGFHRPLSPILSSTFKPGSHKPRSPNLSSIHKAITKNLSSPDLSATRKASHDSELSAKPTNETSLSNDKSVKPDPTSKIGSLLSVSSAIPIVKVSPSPTHKYTDSPHPAYLSHPKFSTHKASLPADSHPMAHPTSSTHSASSPHLGSTYGPSQPSEPYARHGSLDHMDAGMLTHTSALVDEERHSHNSPGLRRRLLASEVLNRTGTYTFLHHLEDNNKKISLSKPKHYSPPLVKRVPQESLSKSTFYAPSVIPPKDDLSLGQLAVPKKLSARRSQSLPFSNNDGKTSSENNNKHPTSHSQTEQSEPSTKTSLYV